MKKQLVIVGIVVMLLAIGLSGCTTENQEKNGDTADNGQYNPPENGNGGFVDDFLNVEVIKTGSSYQTVESNPMSGWFTSGQDADILLNWFDFDNSGGPLRFYHPMGITNDGQHLLLADTCNNRVLIWNSLPTGNVAPDIVLGQDDFYSNEPGTTQDKLR
jgi:hypothetical protein